MSCFDIDWKGDEEKKIYWRAVWYWAVLILIEKLTKKKIHWCVKKKKGNWKNLSVPVSLTEWPPQSKFMENFLEGGNRPEMRCQVHAADYKPICTNRRLLNLHSVHAKMVSRINLANLLTLQRSKSPNLYPRKEHESKTVGFIRRIFYWWWDSWRWPVSLFR